MIIESTSIYRKMTKWPIIIEFWGYHIGIPYPSYLDLGLPELDTDGCVPIFGQGPIFGHKHTLLSIDYKRLLLTQCSTVKRLS